MVVAFYFWQRKGSLNQSRRHGGALVCSAHSNLNMKLCKSVDIWSNFQIVKSPCENAKPPY